MAHSKKSTFQIQHIPKRAHFKKDTFQKQHIPKRAHSKEGIVQTQHSERVYVQDKFQDSQRKVHSKKSTFQIGHISKREKINILQKVANLGQPSLKLHNPTDTSLYVADIVRTFMYLPLFTSCYLFRQVDLKGL